MQSPAKPAWLVKAKVEPPRHQVELAERRRLIDRLNHGAGRSLTLLSAPAGFGKSTLLMQWCALLEKRENTTVAWLTVGHDDLEESLVSYCGFALEQAGIAIPASFWQSDFLDESGHAAHGMAMLLNEIERYSGRVVLVLDDLDVLRDSESLALVRLMVHQRPENFHVVIACRDIPEIPVWDLRVGGMVSDMSAEDLRFSPEEVKAFLGNAINSATVRLVLDQTEGWPAAVQLLRQKSGAHLTESSLATHLAESAEMASNYIRETILSAMTAQELQRLQELSTLDWVQQSAIDSLFERDLRDDYMSALERIRPMTTVSTDGAYRLHPMLRDCLSSDFRRSDPGRFRSVHRRAAKWFAEEGRIVAALAHAKSAEDQNLIGELIEGAGAVRIWLLNGTARLLAVDRYLSESILHLYPRLSLMRCIVDSKKAKYREASERYEAVRLVTRDFTQNRNGLDVEDLVTDQQIVLSTLSVHGCVEIAPELIEYFTRASLPGAAADRAMQGYCKMLLCVANHQIANFDEAMHFARETLMHHREEGLGENSAFVNLHMGSIEFARGNAEAAKKHYRKTQQLIRADFPRDTGLRLTVDTFLGELAMEQNQLESAKRRLQSTLAKMYRAEAWFDSYAAFYSTNAEYLFNRKGLDDALYFLDDAHAYIDDQKLDNLLGVVMATRVSVLCMGGRTQEAAGVAADAGLMKVGGWLSSGRWRWREAEASALAILRLWICLEEFQKAIELAAQLTDVFESKDMFRSLLSIRVLTAIALWKNEKQQEAAETLAKAVQQRHQSGFERAFWRDRPDVIEILTWLNSNCPQLIAQDDELLERLSRNAVKQKALAFSPREKEVLVELRQGLPDKVIARQLGVSEHTVRFHLRNIYAKTSANNRLEAVANAQRLGLLD